ncbi:permease prefix domain 1-containing protein [Jidongwangia harbinensis]|uniref:permease prefix domain 1-containing protein n=1 Tax=Jidongwangia harbinensis TaxID=2878561 RepID=UPI001CD9183D|nr:permease prefix domain 1-containing protein [Jidongwangia harbinensis]MCA2219247.1 permease prefix domain 1-containing protein [Jidongwangia harbinensis]
MTAPTGDGPVEQYLDEMFDRLAGTGSAGRRLLAEAEGHLLTAAADGRARGLDAATAEREAIARFGTVTSVVRHVPAPARAIRAALRPLLTGTWLAVGLVLLWWGGSGVLTWLLGWPWTRLLIATDGFGGRPDMCGRPWVPPDPAADCFTRYREYLHLVPQGGDRDTYPWVAVGGALILVAWLLVRRTTVLGSAAWTPAPVVFGLGLAVPFGLAAPVLAFYGISGAFPQAQNWALSHLTAGLLAAVIGVAAARHVRARPRRT